MLKNYIKIALRNLYRNKIYSLINILGLAIGLAATITLFLYIRFELSYDKHFDDHEKIYKIISSFESENGQNLIFPSSIYEIPVALKSSIPEVKYSTNTTSWSLREIKVDNISKGFHRSVLVDSCFLKVFTLKSLYNNRKDILKDPKAIVLTESLSKTIFGIENPVGKVVQISGKDMIVSDVIEDLPENTHFQFDFLISINMINEEDLISNGNSYGNYIRFIEIPDEKIIKKTAQFISDFTDNKFKEWGVSFYHDLDNIRDIHLHSNYTDKDTVLGNMQYIYIFTVLSFFILFIAIFNYVNLFTAKSETRLKEVGIRKVMGATRKSLINQFIGESVIVSLFAFLIAMLLVESFLTKFGNLVGSKIDFIYSQNIILVIGFILVSIFVGVLSGIYPAFYIVKFNIVNILKGITSDKKKNKLKVGLVVLQFSISIALISSLFGLFGQVKYMKNKDLGFKKNQVVVYQALTSKVVSNYESIKGELLKNNGILGITASQSIPGIERSGMNMRLPEWALEEAIPISENRVQDDYINTYGLRLISGSDFSHKLASDSSGFILNEAAVKLLNIENPIGKKIIVWQNEGYIQGIIKDFHFASLHDKIEPLVLSNYSSNYSKISILIEEGKINESIKYIESVFDEFDPDYTQNYFFIDKIFNRMYNKEDKANHLILYASVLAILISLLGLLALTSFTVSRRTKEIGVRKALGSNIAGILLLLNIDIIKWVLVSSLIGIPVSYFFLEKWLQNFAFRIEPHLWIFICALLIVIIFAIITITIQSYTTARKNPTESLRYE